MSDITNLDYLREEVRKLKALLDDPHPGLMSWMYMYRDQMNFITEFWDGESRESNELKEMTTQERKRLPITRRSITHKFAINNHEGYLTVGLYEDGSPGELFIIMSKEGSTVGGLMDGIGILVSLALQHGTKLETLVDKFKSSRFEPAGRTENEEIQDTTSVLDYIFRWLELTFLKGAK